MVHIRDLMQSVQLACAAFPDPFSRLPGSDAGRLGAMQGAASHIRALVDLAKDRGLSPSDVDERLASREAEMPWVAAVASEYEMEMSPLLRAVQVACGAFPKPFLNLRGTDEERIKAMHGAADHVMALANYASENGLSFTEATQPLKGQSAEPPWVKTAVENYQLETRDPEFLKKYRAWWDENVGRRM